MTDGPPAVVDRDLAKMEQICRNHHTARIQTEEERVNVLEARCTGLSAFDRATPTTILEDAQTNYPSLFWNWLASWCQFSSSFKSSSSASRR
jgi:hypothetical protein